MYYAFENNNFELFKYLIEEENISPEERVTNENVTIFLLSCKKVYVPFVKYLIEEAYVNIRATDYKGRNALHYSCISGNKSLVKYLIENLGFDKDSVSNKGDTILYCSILSKNLELVQYVVEELHVTNPYDNDHFTPLSAKEYYNKSIINYLLQRELLHK